MKRIPEPELMQNQNQSQAYWDTDIDSFDLKAGIDLIQILSSSVEGLSRCKNILDLGCGPGNFTFRLAQNFPEANITAIDGSLSMLNQAAAHKANGGYEQVDFVQALIPSEDIPKNNYNLIISTRFLHQLHEPKYLWETVRKHSNAGTKVFIFDLRRPYSKEAAKRIVDWCAHDKPEVFKEDFYNSFLAAFTVDEIKQQLQEADLGFLSVSMHKAYIAIHGEIPVSGGD